MTITNVIPKQGFEVVRDRIADILTIEIDTQAQLSYEAYLDLVTVHTEIANPIDKIELPCIIVSFANDNFSNKSQGSEDGLCTYHIDVYTSAKSTATIPGDKIAALRLQKLLGLCRYILADPIYKTLGLSTPFIGRVYNGEINIGQINTADAINTAMGRLTLYVVCNESNKFITPSLIAGYTTSVQLDESDLGYFYEGV